MNKSRRSRNVENLKVPNKMSNGDLICNFKKCRKILTETAFITRCSHAFCEEDALREIENQNEDKKCPACQSPLIQSYDLVKVVLNPSEQFKSMVLAGIRPEAVMDIATRAIMFWKYQMQQENHNQKMISKTLKDSLAQMKNNFEVDSDVLKSKIRVCERKIYELERELEKQHRKCIELSEKLSEKNREVQTWQASYEAMRRKQFAEAILQPSNNPGGKRENNFAPFKVGPQTMDELLVHHKFKHDMQGQYQRGCDMRREDCSPRKPDGRHGFYYQPQGKLPQNSPKVIFEPGGCSTKWLLLENSSENFQQIKN